MKKKQMYFNLLAQLISFGVSFAISFFVSPIIVREVGKETYGFLGMANNFVGYVTIITVALNSLAGRFITICLHKNDEDSANRYFSSVFFSDLIVVAVLLIPSIVFICFLDKFFNVPPESVLSVKVTFGLVFLGFFVQLLCSVFSVATFATNKLYLASIRTIEANLLRIAVVVATFLLFGANIAFVSLGMMAYYSFIALTNVRYTKRLLPQIQVRKKYFDFAKIKELLISGIWSSITALSNTLLEGIDLLISNLMLGAGAMGTVSIVKTVPSMIYQCIYSVVGVFTPQMTINYAKGKINELIDYMDYATKLVGCILALPVGFIIAFGGRFFSLWMPTEDGRQLWMLAVLALGELLYAGSVIVMHNLFTVTNNLKKPAIATLITGVLSTVTVLTLLNTTDLGIFAIVSVSSILGFLKNGLFVIPYSAACIDQKPWRFYWMAARSLLFVALTAAIGFGIAWLIPQAGWLQLILCAGLMCLLSIVTVFVCFFNKKEKREVFRLFKKNKKEDSEQL